MAEVLVVYIIAGWRRNGLWASTGQWLRDHPAGLQLGVAPAGLVPGEHSTSKACMHYDTNHNKSDIAAKCVKPQSASVKWPSMIA